MRLSHLSVKKGLILGFTCVRFWDFVVRKRTLDGCRNLR